MNETHTEEPGRDENHPAIVGDVVFGSPDSPVAVCTLGSRSLLPELAGRKEIAVAGRVFTENVGVERMIQNLSAFETVRFLIVCGRETRHRVGATILALHRNGLDADRRVIGSDAPEPIMPNLTTEQLRLFQERVTVVDMIGSDDVAAVIERASFIATMPGTPVATAATVSAPVSSEHDVVRVTATRDPSSAWEYDPVGYFLVFVDRTRSILRVEHHAQDHRLVTVFEGSRAEELCHTMLRRGNVSLLAHAAYLGRELAKAETALALGLDYEQDRPLVFAGGHSRATMNDNEEKADGNSAGNRGAP
jgi:tetrahydromethanopterin S-methyltransferase subunit A